MPRIHHRVPTVSGGVHTVGGGPSADDWEATVYAQIHRQPSEHKAKECHTRIGRRRSDKRAVRVCTQHTKRDRTIDTGREGTPEEVQEQTAPDSK